ncbi:MAG: sugar phosphate nucleotidyltransferase, partial [Candidatus Micrarchaeota archaeon]
KEQLGLGDAVLCAEKHIGSEPFALLLGDIIVESKVPCTKQLMEKHAKHGAGVIAVEEVAKENVGKYGIVKPKGAISETFEVGALVEKPLAANAPSNLAIIGRYVLEADIFDELKNAKPGKNGEIQLTDSLNAIAQKRKLLATKFEGKSYDIGDKLAYAEAFAGLAMKRKDIGQEFRESLRKMLGSS